jgi:hypothetical protein
VRKRCLPLLALAPALGLALLPACTQTKPGPAPITSQTAGLLQMDLTTEPPKPLMNQNVKLRLKVADPGGKPVNDATVTASLTMPLMDMGKNEVKLQGIGNGQYEGTAKFTMAGPWNVVVTASSEGKSVQQTIPLAVRE